MSNHDHEEMEKHFDKLLISIDSVQLNFATEFYSVLEKYAEHYAAKQQPESTAILEAAKELGRIEVLDMLKDYELAYDPLGGWIIDSTKEVRNMDNNSALLEYLDAHREVVS